MSRRATSSRRAERRADRSRQQQERIGRAVAAEMLERRVLMAVFSNTSAIAINDEAAGSPYPSTITVSGVVDALADVNVTLKGLTHSYTADIDVLLVGPGGQKVILMSDCGEDNNVSDIDIKLNDEASAALLGTGFFAGGMYRPTDFESGDAFHLPAPAGPYATTLSAFDGSTVNGTWSLYVMDDFSGDAGTIAGGWELEINGTDPPSSNSISISSTTGEVVPYPSELVISGMSGAITDLNVTLTGVSHTWPDDLDILLVAPSGENVILMSDVGGSFDAVALNLTLDDSAVSTMPDDDEALLESGTYTPTNYVGEADTWGAPAPTVSGSTLLSTFNGINPNGTWKLFVSDGFGPDDGGSIDGWSLSITTAAALGSISGTEWKDIDGDAVKDAGEPVLSGWTVYADLNSNGSLNVGEPSVVTDGSGDYTITDLAAGTYAIREVVQAGWVQTSPAGAAANNVVLGAGQAAANVNFGNFPTIFTGGAGADTYTLRMDSAANGKVQILESLSGGSVTTYSIDKSLLTTLTFNTGGGNDTLTINHGFGSPIPSTSVTYNGETATTSDKLIVVGAGAAQTTTFTASTVTMGGLTSFASVEKVTFDGVGGLDTVNVNGGAVTFPTSQFYGSLTIASGATATLEDAPGPDLVLFTKSLNIAATGRLDLTDNNLVIDYTGSSPLGSWNGSAYTGVTGYLQSGFDGGSWSGHGISSSTAAALGGPTALAPGESSTVLGLSGAQTDLWNGVEVDATCVLVKYTYAGDADVNGELNGDDYFYIDSNVLQSGFVFGYGVGDFDYNGEINGDDYFWLDSYVVYAQASGPI